MTFPSVLKIHATYQEPDYDCPWQARTPGTGTGSGIVLPNGLILTAAHVVANTTFLQVQKTSNSRRQVAHVAAICHDADLALLQVEDAAFLKGIPTLELGDLPALRDKVLVCGYPIGGNEISITEGVVSRVEVQQYSHSQRHLLAVTVDAAINSGNSGGPVIQENKIIGVAFQSLEDAENIGEVIPIPVIRHFLEAHERGLSTSIPGLGIRVQKLENSMLRDHLGLPEDFSGVLVSSVHFDNSAWGFLREGDVLMEIDGIELDNDGTVMLASRYRTSFLGLSHNRFVNEEIHLKIWRDGEAISVYAPLKPLRYLVPRSRYDVLPSYYIYGGLVFQPLTRDFLSTWDKWYQNAPKELLDLYYHGYPTPERRQVIVLSHVLADEINVGYEGLENTVISHVNGNLVGDLRELIDAIESSPRLLELKTSHQLRIVMEKSAADKAHSRILRRYRIHKDRSDDLV
ncbi:MAG: trypsin-like peptidase domain-containing protein [Myxococcales bacterium]|nr:trypsin-like peptidase domain-containing protein [Myxococcales bacterium]